MTKPTLLIVEDDVVLASAMRDKFLKEGFSVKVTTDGDRAIKYLEEKIPQVVVLDILMPKKNGFDILSLMKSNPIWKKIPVLIASNLDSNQDIEKGYSLGAGDYIVKSNLSLNDLVKKVLFLINSTDQNKK